MGKCCDCDADIGKLGKRCSSCRQYIINWENTVCPSCSKKFKDCKCVVYGNGND